MVKEMPEGVECYSAELKGSEHVLENILHSVKRSSICRYIVRVPLITYYFWLHKVKTASNPVA